MNLKDFLTTTCGDAVRSRGERSGEPRAPRIASTTINLQDGTCRLSRLKPKRDRDDAECERIKQLVHQANEASRAHREALAELAKLGPFSPEELKALHWNHHRGLPFSIMGLVVDS